MASIYMFVDGFGDTITCDNCGKVVPSWFSNDFHAVCVDCPDNEQVEEYGA